MKDIKLDDYSYEVIGAAFDTFKKVGPGFNELIYHKIFHHELLRKGLNCKYKVQTQLDYSGKKIATFEIDEIVEDKLIVELKCIQTAFIPENFAQMMTYQKVTNIRVGLLINFGLHKAFPKRVIFDEKIEPDNECWEDRFFNDSIKQKLIENVISSIRRVNQILGPGYHNKIYEEALDIEFHEKQIVYHDNIPINLKIENIQFNQFIIDFWLVEGSLLLAILAGKEKPRVCDISRLRCYIQKLNINHGLIAYWSNKNLQLIGIYSP